MLKIFHGSDPVSADHRQAAGLKFEDVGDWLVAVQLDPVKADRFGGRPNVLDGAVDEHTHGQA